MLSATVLFADGSQQEVSTDEEWLARRNGAYTQPCHYDSRIQPDPYVAAEGIPDIWNARLAPIPVRTEEEIPVGELRLGPGETFTGEFDLDRIYGGFLHLTSQGEGEAALSFTLREVDNTRASKEEAVLRGTAEYRDFYTHSLGNLVVTAENSSQAPLTVSIGFITTCYPVTVSARTETEDSELNDILEVCRHTLQYCRQTHHLDSPRHCEPLACTGDYYIEALMTAFSFGDMRLAEFDLLRTAELLRHQDGRMFHTTYSLIWVRMLYDVYMFSGRRSVLEECRDALDLLFARFSTYLGENGLIENPPDYMFVDWIYIDGLSMHHPPKALGQTVLNMFYYMALGYGSRIYRLLGEEGIALDCEDRRCALRKAVNTLLYDAERGMYFEGLNTPIPEAAVYQWQPQNVEKRYYLKHSNIMAAYTEICDKETGRMLLEKIMRDEIEGEVQPYFQHYLLEAVYTHGLREKYTLPIIQRWKPAVADCRKGLVEGFFPPEPTYVFDHSHAWGGTPLYSLPKALLGFTLEEAGLRKIRLDPSLLGLKRASVELPTPYGMLLWEWEEGKAPRLEAPDGVTVLWDKAQ